ncbi:unnamed protein product [Rotaria magnacalcarata]|uniref:G-protein coupled receptors family 1 profile domain-containing protein n=2 Tax=Rotaria magnacalcarata TaxID=392030 RepID=A0A816TWR0_9BILA|nr:unnamed protein product [Rotaria magnacalcarata]
MDRLPSNITIDDLVIDDVALFESVRKSFTRDPFDHYVNGVCSLFICLLGTISNALSFSILTQRTMPLSTYVYLAGLCLSDFTACLCLIPGCILYAYPIEVPDFKLPRTYTYMKFLIITGAISTTARALSVWLCVAFTIDRWIMICRPFVGPLYCTIKNARRVTFIIYIVGIVYAVPLLFEYEVNEDRSLSDILPPNHAKRMYRYKLSELGSNSVFRWAYVLINALGVYIIPLITIAILNRKLFNSIRLLERRSAEYNAPLPTKQGVTIMLLATTLMLLVFRSPSATVSVMWLISAKMFINEKPPFRLRKFHSIANLCATFNAATTFIMFIIYGTKFRSEFTRIYCSILNKVKKSKRNNTRKYEQKQMKKLISNNCKNENGTNTTDTKNKRSLAIATSPSAHNIHKESLQYNSGVRTSITTATSIVSLIPMRHLRTQPIKQQYSFEHKYDLMMNNNQNSPLQHEIPILEECNGDYNDTTKVVSLNESYYDWFKNCVVRH